MQYQESSFQRFNLKDLDFQRFYIKVFKKNAGIDKARSGIDPVNYSRLDFTL